MLGDILNSNAQYLSRELASLGVGVYYQTCVGDNEDRLYDAYKIAFKRADIVIATGGLGPTKDDLTKETAAKYFGKNLVLHQETLSKIADLFRAQNLDLTKSSEKQALIPEGAKVLPNDNGTAPGLMIEEGGKIMIMMPGPPNELIPMFESAVVPELTRLSGQTLISTVLRLCGIGESAAEERIQDLIDTQTNPTIAPYAKIFEVHLRITAASKSKEEGLAMIAPVKEELYRRLGVDIYGEDDTTLEASVCNLLTARNLKLATAESCTGGLLSGRIVDHPGASAVLLDGIVAYSNESKITRLGVKPETLSKFGAVSAEVAMEMAEGAVRTSGADVGLSVTGVAGPSGGTDQKPVGRMYMGVCAFGKTSAIELNIKGDRAKTRSRAVAVALDYLRRTLLRSAGEYCVD